MRICPRCHARYGDESRFCPRDGAPLPEAADPRLGGVLLGQFTLEAVCGKGAMGTVYRATQAGMDRVVAVKVLRQELLRDRNVVKRFQREAKAVARIQHPNIVTVFLVGETDDGVPFLVMEYVEGEALADLLDRERVLPAARSLRIGRQITSALAEAHALGIVHRDLKPANLVVSQKRRAPDFTYVLDFGIAKILHGEPGKDAESHLSRTGTIFGTPHYIAPEQAGGFEIDHRADLYSLGVILYRMATGRLPFEGSGVAVLLAHMQKPVPPPRSIRPDIEPEIEALILKALTKDPSQRFQSAEEMGDAIDAIRPTSGSLSGAVSSARDPGVPTVGRVEKRDDKRDKPSSGTIARVPPAPPNLTVPTGPGKAAPWTIRGLGGGAASASASAAESEQIVASMPVSPLPGPLPDSTPVPYGVNPDDEGALPPPAPAPARVPGKHDAMTLAAQPTPVPPGPSAGYSRPGAPGPTAETPSAEPAVDKRYTSDVERLADASASGSDAAYRAPGRGRVVALAVAALLAGGGVVGTWIWYQRGREDVAAASPAPRAPSPPAAKPAVTETATPPDSAPKAPEVAPPPPDPDRTTGAGPVLVPEPPAPPSAPKRRLTLGEGGYSARVSMPARILAGQPVEIVIEAFDRKGEPLGGSQLTLNIENPAGVEILLAVPVTDVPGRFAVERSFASGGRHHVHIYPAGRGGQHMYFDLNVDGPRPQRPARLKHRDRPQKHEEKRIVDSPRQPPPPPPPFEDEFAKPPPPKDDPYHPIDPDEPPRKPPPDDDSDILE